MDMTLLLQPHRHGQIDMTLLLQPQVWRGGHDFVIANTGMDRWNEFVITSTGVDRWT